MKRCPQCSFLYLDSDQFCDLDQTLLISEDLGTDPNVIEPLEQKAESLESPLAETEPKPARKWQVTWQIWSAATVAVFVIGLTLLLSFQRERTTITPNHPLPTPQAQASRVSQVAQQVSNEVAAKNELAPPESASPDSPNNSTTPSAEPSPSAAKTDSNTRPESTRVRVSLNPVSTSDISDQASGPVTIQLSDGSMLEADEVWRTKAGIWYRRKGIVTFIKPNRVRTIKH